MNFDMSQNFDETGTYSLTCGDCSWCVVNFDSVGHFAGFICSNHPEHPDVKLTDKCILL